MASKAWAIKLDGELHLVELHHGYWSGRRAVYFDDKLVFRSQRLFDAGSIEGFTYKGHSIVVHIRAHILDFSYDLYVDGHSVTTGEECFLKGAKMYEFKEQEMPQACWLEQQKQFSDKMRIAGTICIFIGAPIMVFGNRIGELTGAMLMLAGLYFIFQTDNYLGVL